KDGVIQKVKVRQGEYKTFEIKAEKYVLATGNFIGGGLIENKGLLREPIFNLPLFDINGKNILHARFQTLINRAVLPPEGHDFIACGVKINDSLQPVDDNENIIYSNLHAAGAVISGYNYIAEKSGMGVAISSGHEVGVQLAGRK
ncbi:MAG: FAD-binding protein, partial [Candidatus Helarchaeota archaeon]